MPLSPPDEPKQIGIKAIEDVILGDPIQGLPGDEPVLREEIVYNSWQYAWGRAVALAWADPNGFGARLIATPAEVLQELGWQIPEKLKISIEWAPTDATYQPTPPGEPRVNGWKDSIEDLKTTVTFQLPQPPKDEDQLVALADYAATGLTYPFTTC